MYTDATRRHLAAPQQQSSFALQYAAQNHAFQPDPRVVSHLPYQSQPSIYQQQSHGVPFDGQQTQFQAQQQHTHQQQIPQPSQPPMQQFNGYNLGDAGSMPPPSTMGGMGMNIGAAMQQGMAQRNLQSYQAHIRNNSQQMPPSSPGLLQSPTSYTTPTPPSGAPAHALSAQSLASPTKQIPPTSIPTSQPPMTSASPSANSPQPPKGQQSPFSEQPTTEAQKADNRKVEIVLEINRILIGEAVHLHSIGKGVVLPVKQGSDAPSQAGGQQSPTGTDGGKDGTTESKEVPQEGDMKSEDGAKKPATSRETIECMRRLQANFAFLTNLASRSSKAQERVIERPPIMDPLPTNIENNSISDETMAAIRDLYKRLKELYPYPAPPITYEDQGQNGSRNPQKTQAASSNATAQASTVAGPGGVGQVQTTRPQGMPSNPSLQQQLAKPGAHQGSTGTGMGGMITGVSGGGVI